MNRFLSVVLFVLTVTAILIGSSVSLGRSQPATRLFLNAEITECDNLPCVQGITPGITNWNDVTTRFAGDSGSTLASNQIVTGTNRPVQTSLIPDATNEKVFAIGVIFTTPYIPLSSLFTEYGMPCKLRTYTSGGLEVIYPRLTATLDMFNATGDKIVPLSPDSKIARMDFYARVSLCKIAPANNTFYDQEWHSFADVQKRYQRGQ